MLTPLPGSHPCIPPARRSLNGETGGNHQNLELDPALRIDAASLPWQVYDLGAEWVAMTGLPMVFAVWAGRKGTVTPELAAAFQDSCRYGLAHLEEIVAAESAARGFAPGVVRQYLTRHIVHELGPRDYQGMELFLEYASRGAAAAMKFVTPV